MGSVVLDASVLVALADPDDALHERAAGAVRKARDESAQLVMPATVLAEVLIAAARLGAGERRRACAAFRAIAAVADINADIAERAAELRAKHGSLRLPDALVIATAILTGADRLLTGDRRMRRVDRRVTVI